MKFYLDENLSPRIAETLRKRKIDAVSTYEVGHRELSDREQLAFASRSGRCLVTRDVRDFVRLAQEAIQTQTPHAGILLCSRRFRGAEVGPLAIAIARVARRFPRGMGGYDVLFL